jgi:AraC-like DNA-binding protein
VIEINVHFHVETSQLVKEHILSVIDQFSDFLRRVRKNNQDSPLDPIGSATNDEKHPLKSVLAPEVFKKLPFSLVFDRTMLEQANPFSNPAEYKLLGKTLLNDTNRVDEPLQYTRLVMAQVAQAFENKAACNLKDIATLNSISEATLKRKLSNEGNRFVAIKAKLRADQALLLLEQGVPQDSISDYLQYACPTGFSRSFKAWYGVNPTKTAERLHPSTPLGHKESVI